jgi:hypothetical protein
MVIINPRAGCREAAVRAHKVARLSLFTRQLAQPYVGLIVLEGARHL